MVSLLISTTTVNAGIIVTGKNAVACTDTEVNNPYEKRSMFGVIVTGLTGIIVTGLTGIIVLGASADQPSENCGIIVTG